MTRHVANLEVQERVQKMYNEITPLQSEDIAAAIVYAVTPLDRVNVNKTPVRPTEQQN